MKNLFKIINVIFIAHTAGATLDETFKSDTFIDFARSACFQPVCRIESDNAIATGCLISHSEDKKKGYFNYFSY